MKTSNVSAVIQKFIHDNRPIGLTLSTMEISALSVRMGTYLVSSNRDKRVHPRHKWGIMYDFEDGNWCYQTVPTGHLTFGYISELTLEGIRYSPRMAGREIVCSSHKSVAIDEEIIRVYPIEEKVFPYPERVVTIPPPPWSKGDGYICFASEAERMLSDYADAIASL